MSEQTSSWRIRAITAIVAPLVSLSLMPMAQAQQADKGPVVKRLHVAQPNKFRAAHRGLYGSARESVQPAWNINPWAQRPAFCPGYNGIPADCPGYYGSNGR